MNKIKIEEIEKIMREIERKRRELEEFVPFLAKIDYKSETVNLNEIEAKLVHVRENPRNAPLMLLFAATSSLSELQHLLYLLLDQQED
jgi:hypothetical protein